ncbi:four-carbon acid sugar kinase family protein [Kocuria sp.]|uniref:four-carbon acid sugar kinase family protein n=1 Tax=Kocuria sp. TaxID=1871328 RepID=UPI0026E036E9|nr:four-carbon acid sugar kinase family protein [Kocuria sp.]MDO5618082.1 four-carbon acid sugar kinase family protein [Kocuria sp.]
MTRRLLVFDDDPTGSQAVHDVDVVLELAAQPVIEALAPDGATCFVLTNSRALDQDQAVAKQADLLRQILDGLPRGTFPHLVSRSDSTLRGHVLAEPNGLADVLAERGVQVNGFLFAPAMFEAGRYTVEDTHWAVLQGEQVKVGDTDFAQDATFGYSNSNLKDFLVERSGGSLRREDILSIALDDINAGVEAVSSVLDRATDRTWVVVNGTDYSHQEVVAAALELQEAAGRTFITRCGPSFVRPLAGIEQAKVLEPADITIGPDRKPHGLLVVGSHVGLTNRQLQVVKDRGGLFEIELDVPTLLTEQRQEHLEWAINQADEALVSSDVVVYTSRDLVRAEDPQESLAIARSVSDAVVEVVRGVMKGRPAWVIAKGGITSHEVAHKGLGIRRARVGGQFFPGQTSQFMPIQADPEAEGCPFVVFPGNVGTESAVADVVEVLAEATRLASQSK